MNLRRLGLLVKRIFPPPKLAAIRNVVGPRSVRVLDVGCGNDSCQLTRYWLRVSEYHGVDREHWNNQSADYAKMDRVFILDLDSDDLSQIPDEHYDVVIMNHVIEHLENGYTVVESLLRKLAKNGAFYIETPSYRTLNFPSATGFLNFYDDPTHKRLYDVQQIVDLLMAKEMRVRSFGIRRSLTRILFMTPVSVVLNLLWFVPIRRRLLGTGLWDVLGVANFVLATKDLKGLK